MHIYIYINLTSLWDGIVDEDEDGLLGVKLDPLTDDVNELPYKESVKRNPQMKPVKPRTFLVS